MIKANDKNLRSWIVVPENSDFPIQNIPFGVYKAKDGNIAVATRIGNTVIDLFKLGRLEYLSVDAAVFNSDQLNKFMHLGKVITRKVRDEISAVFNAENEKAKNDVALKETLYQIDDVEMLLPISVGDYTDFY